LEKERFNRTKPNSKFFHISKKIMPNNDKEMKCLITEVENILMPGLSSPNGEETER
jgi:hypothetical protein